MARLLFSVLIGEWLVALRTIQVIIVCSEREVVRNVFSVLAVNPEDLSLIRVLMTLPFKDRCPVRLGS